ncbi:hypothetical protein IGI39_004671 [Enterococcus sp. AZ135]|uniref:MFS transporter n=1 Tax=unclassified Enterococcus TaxID=2608891 RepID=UPI003F256B11
MSEQPKSKGKRNLILLILSLIAGMVFLTPLLRFSFYDQMKVALGLTDIQLGTIGSIYGIFNVLCYAPSGFLAEKFSTKKLLLASTIGMTATTIWYFLLPGFTSLLIIHALYGVFSVGTFWSPYLTAIRQLGSEEEQGRIYGVSESLRGIGQTLIAMGCLAVVALFSSEVAGFRMLLAINAVVFAVLTVAVMIFMPNEEKKTAGNTGGVKTKTSFKDSVAFKTLTSSSTWICIFVIMCGYALWHTVNGFIGTYCTRVLHLTPSVSSTLSIIRSYIIVFVAGLSGGVIIDKFKTKGQGMMLVYAGLAISVVAIFFTSTLTAVCIVATVILSYMTNVIKSTYWSILGDAGIPVETTGMATGLISLIALTPEIFVPPVVSRFITYGESIGNVKLGFDMMLVWLVVWAVLGVGASLILKKRKEKIDSISVDKAIKTEAEVA